MSHPIGQSILELETPVLLVDLDALSANIRVMADFIAARGKQWRPHAKAIKTPAIANMLIDGGAIGLTVAKVSEAEVYAASGIKDLLIAHLVVGPAKAARLAALQHYATVRATVDHPDQLPALSEAARAAGVTIGLLVDLDIGLGRTGVRSTEAAVSLGRKVQASPGLRLDGLMGYEGHALYIQEPAEKRAAVASAVNQLAVARDAFRNANLTCPIVSAAGSGSYQITAHFDCVTELQAGGAIFACPYYTELCKVDGLTPAISILASVVSRPTNERAIVDAGLKCYSNFRCSPKLPKYPESRIVSMSAEHTTIDFPSGPRPAICEKIEITPSYSDLTTVLHDVVVGTRDRRVETVWPLTARGKLQ